VNLRYGAFGGVNLAIHSASIAGVPGAPTCCPGYSSGIGWNPAMGITAELPIASATLFGANLAYSGLSAVLEREEPTAVIVNGSLENGAFTHTIDATLATISLEPYVKQRLVGPLFATGGLHLGYFINAQYSQSEVITSPANSGTFVDQSGMDTRSRIRNASNGDLPETSIHVAVSATLQVELPLNRNQDLLLVPFITGGLGLTNITGQDWRAHVIRGGVALLFEKVPKTDLQMDTPAPAPSPTTPPPPLPPPVIAAAPLLFEGDVTVQARDAAGNLVPVRRLTVEETISEQLTALLPFVFFDRGSAQLPSRYQHSTRGFSEKALFGYGALAVYHRMLDIVGSRMAERPGATLDLIGCIMPDEMEEASSGLAMQRAQAVKEYIVNGFSIDASRIRVSARELPAQPSNVKSADGQQENRRVELSSNDPAIIDVLQLEDTLRTANPPAVLITLPVKSQGTVTTWHVRARQGSVVLLDSAAPGEPPASIEWRPATPPSNPPETEEPIVVDFEVSNAQGRTIVRADTLACEQVTLRKKLERRQGNKRVDEYNLILFAFGKSALEASNKRIVELIRRRIEPASTVLVRGHADRTGTAAVNDPLTQQRAEVVAAELNHPGTDAKGLGQRDMIYDNDLPEGRFYNRTVRVRVETPVE
jgi:outer membrane protein OmpA-like peptidoglycan-associated protein